MSNVCQVQLHHGGRAHAPGRRSFAPARDCSRWFLQRVCGGAGDRDDGFAQQVQGRAYQERTKTELALNAAAAAQDELAALRLENQALRRARSEMHLAAAEREARLGSLEAEYAQAKVAIAEQSDVVQRMEAAAAVVRPTDFDAAVEVCPWLRGGACCWCVRVCVCARVQYAHFCEVLLLQQLTQAPPPSPFPLPSALSPPLSHPLQSRDAQLRALEKAVISESKDKEQLGAQIDALLQERRATQAALRHLLMQQDAPGAAAGASEAQGSKGCKVAPLRLASSAGVPMPPATSPASAAGSGAAVGISDAPARDDWRQGFCAQLPPSFWDEAPPPVGAVSHVKNGPERSPSVGSPSTMSARCVKEGGRV